ncbi:MAG: hypothetical protein WAM82_19870, partial [Thermoanaerobaculia bacterium]
MAAGLLGQAAAARATVLGPETATILGWSPKDQKIYYAIYPGAESDDLPPRLYHFDLNSSQPERPVQVYFRHPPKAANSSYYGYVNSKIEVFRKSLVQLPTPVRSKLGVSSRLQSAQKMWKNKSATSGRAGGLEIWEPLKAALEPTSTLDSRYAYRWRSWPCAPS